MSDLTKQAITDAGDFIAEYHDEIVKQLMEDDKASYDWNNDYTTGGAFFHETYVDRSYTPLEAAQVLEEFDRFEETDWGLWENQSPREAIATQAAYTYGNAVGHFLRKYIEKINNQVELLDWDSEDEEELEKQVSKIVEEVDIT